MTADDLRTALHGYMHRDDPDTVANEPTAIELARQAIEKTFFPMESEILLPAATVTSGRLALPADFGRAVSVGNEYSYIAPRIWERLTAQAPENLRGSYSIFGGSIYVYPGVSVLTVRYNGRPMPITGSATNWLSLNYAEVWLHAARAEQYRFIEDMDMATATEQLWQGLVDEFMDTSERRRQSGGALRMRSR